MRTWIDRLFAVYAQSPAPGFQKVTQAQLLRADRQAFIRMSELFSGSLKTYVGAGKPLDQYVERMETDMTVTYFMLPIPTAHGSSSSAATNDKVDKKRTETPTKPVQPNNKYQKGAAKGGQKGGKGKKRDPIPQALKGMHSRTPQGDPICFGYNLGTCKQGAKCPRQHVCAVPGCYKSHPQTEHQ